MTITCEEFLNELEESEETLSRGVLSVTFHAMRNMAKLAADAKILSESVRKIVLETPNGQLSDPDGVLVDFLETSYRRLRMIQGRARRLKLIGALPLLHHAAFYLLKSRYYILSHDAPDCAIPEPTMRPVRVSDVFSAVLGGPWAVASLLKN